MRYDVLVIHVLCESVSTRVWRVKGAGDDLQLIAIGAFVVLSVGEGSWKNCHQQCDAMLNGRFW